MGEPDEGVREKVLSMAAVLTAVHGRLRDLSGTLPDEEEAGPEGEVRQPGLKSILSCVLQDDLEPAIRGLLGTVEQEPESPADYHEVVGRVNAALPRLLREHERRRRELQALAGELVALDDEERRLVLKEQRFHRADLVDELVDQAGSALPESPARGEELARLAQDLALHLPDPLEAGEGQARAACRLAHARRLAGDHAGAAQLLSAVSLYQGEGEVEGEVCRALALLRWEEGRLEEAAALLTRAAAVWALEESSHEEAACQVLWALLLIEEGRAKDVVPLLREELPALVDTWLTLYGSLGFALGLAEQGLEDRARAVRAEGAALVRRAPVGAYLYALWLEGEIAASLSETAVAVSLFEDLRREALTAGLAVEASIATLALASLDLEGGAGSAPGEARAAELEARFPEVKSLAGVVGMLRDFPNQVSSGGSPRELAAVVGATFRRVLGVSNAPSAPRPFI
jgi:hypothetical protein